MHGQQNIKTLYSCHILIQIEFSRQIFRRLLKYQMSRKSVQWEPICSTRADRQTWRS